MNDEKAIEQLEEFLVIDDWSVVYMPYLQDAIEYVINRIKALEERSQGEWIPVSERLPEEEGDYLITPYRYNVTIDHFVNGKFVFFNNNAIAWQSLPEPYKKGDTE